MAHCDHKIMSDNDRRKFISDELYFKSSTEMRSVFSETPQLLANTLAIADKISFKFVWQNYLPKISKQDPDQELTELVSKRISLYYQNTELLKAQARAAHELEIIKQLGNAEYFLIVNDYVSWALANNIPRGYGRGSAAGAIVNYVLGITAIDPLAQGLIFERFINPERISLPDIDIDVSLKDRSRVMEYIINRYGEENAAVARSIGADPHASGLALANTNLKNITPLKADPADLLPRTQLALYDLEELGVLKIDIYGLRSLDIVHKCEEYISKNYDNEFRIMNLPFDDQATFKLMQKGDTFACFQLESAGVRKILRKIKPTTFSDITAIASFLYRAAPFESGIVAQYIARKLGKEKFKLLFPELKPYLAETYGLIIYQEQLMQIAHTIGGFSMSKADILRKAMGKKKADIIAKLREEFVTGAVAKGHNKKASENIYDTCAKFAEYGFNKAHAVSYAALTYTTAYLKANYPTEYMAAVLDNTRMLTPEMEQELCRMGIRLEGYACELLRELVSANTWIKIIPQGTAIIVDYEL